MTIFSPHLNVLSEKSQHLFRYETDFNKAYTIYILYTASSIQSSFQILN